MPNIKTFLKNEIKDLVFITLGLLLYTFGWTVFLLPYNIVTGGVTGMAAIVYYATSIRISYTYFFINVALLLVALKILGFRFLLKTIYAICALSVMLDFAQDLMKDSQGHVIQILGPDQPFMAVVIGCMLTGTSLAIVFLNNGSTGGTDIIAACVNKYKNMSLGTVLLIVDFLIIGSCLFIPQFGTFLERVRMIAFGFCTMAIENFILDYVFNAQRQSVQFMIFSRKYQEIADAITAATDHSLTFLDGHGWYTGKPVKVVCMLARKRESQTIFRIIKSIDPNAFVSQSAVIGVYGEGFDTIKANVSKKHQKQVSNALEEGFKAVDLPSAEATEVEK